MDVTKLAGIVTGIAFMVGVLYNVGYFTALDLQLFPLLSYKDHLETLVFFVPIAVVPTFLCMWLRKKPVRRRVVDYVAIFLAAGTVTYWLERDELVGLPTFSAILVRLVAPAAFLLLAYCASLILQNLLDLGDGADEKHTRVIALAAVGILVFVTLFGNVRAHLDAAQSRFDIAITLTSETGPKPEIRKARLVRAIDAGLLLVFEDAPGQLAYARNETVRTIAEPLRP